MTEEITVNSMYDISMRGIANTNLPLSEDVDREVCINIDDGYRPTVFNGTGSLSWIVVGRWK